VQSQPTQKEPDILAELLAALRQKMPHLETAIINDVEAQIRQQFGGKRSYIPKRRAHLDPATAQSLYLDGLSNAPTEQVITKYRISKATLYRRLKRG
jgi:Mor family transcriptional regulator